MDSKSKKSKFKGLLYLLLVFLVMAGSTIAWLYFDSDLPKKTPLRAKQVFIWHNKFNNSTDYNCHQT